MLGFPFGWSHRELLSCDQELTSLGAALVGLVPLEPSDLGLSHLTGPGPNQRKNSNTELLALREVRQAERCSVAFFFP